MTTTTSQHTLKRAQDLSLTRRTGMEWAALANCAGYNVQDETAAKDLCAGCPVAVKCLEESILSGADGVWGALTKEERRVNLPHGVRARYRRGPVPVEDAKALRVAAFRALTKAGLIESEDDLRPACEWGATPELG